MVDLWLAIKFSSAVLDNLTSAGAGKLFHGNSMRYQSKTLLHLRIMGSVVVSHDSAYKTCF